MVAAAEANEVLMRWEEDGGGGARRPIWNPGVAAAARAPPPLVRAEKSRAVVLVRVRALAPALGLGLAPTGAAGVAALLLLRMLLLLMLLPQVVVVVVLRPGVLLPPGNARLPGLVSVPPKGPVADGAGADAADASSTRPREGTTPQQCRAARL